MFLCIKNQRPCETLVAICCLFLFALSALLVGIPTARAQSINITQTQQLTFPTLGAGGNVNLSVNPLNSTTSGTAEIVGGSAQRGQYALSLVSGGTPLSISIDISGVSTGNAGLTLDNFSGLYKGQSISFPSSTLSLPATSPATTPLYIGARITADSTVGNGSYSPSFTINVYIQ